MTKKKRRWSFARRLAFEQKRFGRALEDSTGASDSLRGFKIPAKGEEIMFTGPDGVTMHGIVFSVSSSFIELKEKI